MEVDDAETAASSVSVDVKVFSAAKDNNGDANSIEVQKLNDNGENNVAPTTQKTRGKRSNNSVQSDVPIKLHLSSDENGSDVGQLQSDGMMTLKRKRYKLRRSGSKECLLGFDEESGEAELVKDDGLLYISDGSASPTASPKPVKRFKKSPASGKSSPKIKATTVITNNSKNLAEKSLKPHVVGDNEDTNNEPQPPPSRKANSLNTSSSSTANSSTSSSTTTTTTKKPLSSTKVVDVYRKPFDLGWKRELVWRTNNDSSKDNKADIYFITPNGKKLRSRNDIIPHLGNELTIENFCFLREPLGYGPELETVRYAKSMSRTSAAAATIASAPPQSTSMGKRVSKPKGPKGASPPPEGWTATRALKVNNAALQSSSNSSRHSSSAHNSSTSNSTRHHHSTSTNSGSGGSSSNKHSSSSSSGGGGGSSSKSKKNSVNASGGNESHSSTKAHDTKTSKSTVGSTTTANAAASTSTSISTLGVTGQTSARHEPCTNNCPQAKGKLPQLQCVKCLCIYHHECVGLKQQNSEYRSVDNGGVGSSHRTGGGARDYICETCQTKSTQTTTTPTTTTSRSPASNNMKVNNLPRNSRAEGKLQQTITVVKGKKYVMVTQSNAVPSASQHVNDIENDLRQIKEGIQHTHRKTSSGSNTDINAAAVERSNKLFAANFFANVSYAYDALVCILKYLKIHERSRAASVCKLWHLAAKDTSLWQTVRMKNSKVCNWSGFAAALRRGETKHLDLRKMLLSSGRSDEMWQAFSEHIGTVCSLEAIDLCRCSSRVVESLFESNKHLHVLNAVAINDDTINLENIGLMSKLQELRLRTCEASVIVGDLQPLRALKQLTHLSLTAVRGLGAKSIDILGEMTALRSLELGECGDFDNTFGSTVLPQLVNLQRLRLENGTETGCCTLGILEAVTQLKHLTQLELVNFDIKPGFDEKLCQCINVRKLLIIPTYISQSATTNHIVLSAVQQIASTLQVFTWGVTVELLRVTALYVDQCDDSMKKKKHHFDECIPVLKPVPGAPPAEEDENAKQGTSQPPSDVPQIEILPLDKVETILGENLPRTKFTIVKVPYIATSKQQLVE